MAAATVASSLLHAKLSNLSVAYSPIPLPLPTHFLSKPFKPLKLNTQIPNSLSLLSLPHFHRTFAAFDSFQVAQDDPQTETEDEYQQEQDEEEEELKPTESNEEGRLYVGNLPYSMTSSQLAEVFEEAGGVVNAEV